MITVEKSDPFSSESYRLIEMLSEEFAAIMGDNGKAIGCGAIRPLTQNTAELKRMFSDRSVPGIGRASVTLFSRKIRKRYGI